MATKYWRVENLATNGWNITDPRLDVKSVSYTHLRAHET